MALSVLLIAKTNQSIELYTNGHIPSQSRIVIFEPHVLEVVYQVERYVFIEASFDIVKDEGEIVQPRDHHVQSSDPLSCADFLVKDANLDRYLAIPKLPPELVVYSIWIHLVLAFAEHRMLPGLYLLLFEWRCLSFLELRF